MQTGKNLEKEKMKIFDKTYNILMEGFEKEKKEGLHGWFSRNKGKGWIDCKTGKPCGRQEGEKRRSYPACRPTKSACNSRKRHKKGAKRISWKKGDKTK
jgi:hypothetical protein